MELSVLNNNFQGSGGGHLHGYQNTNMGGYGFPGGHTNPENMIYGSNPSVNQSEESDATTNDAISSHREMAIDVPTNFVGHKKEPPRYPPPHSIQSSTSSQYSTPSKPAKNNSCNPPLQQPPKMTEEEEQAHMNRIKVYQEDLRKRREQEENFQREQEFLRNSLRDSQKLQSLEQSRMVRDNLTGVVNPNYMIEEEDAIETVSRASTLPVRERYVESYPQKPLGRFKYSTNILQ